MAQKPALLDTKAAATDLGISASRVLQFINSGRLPAQMMGGIYLIRRADLAKVRVRKPGRPKKKR
jgi:excisionase family DNA binding protein